MDSKVIDFVLQVTNQGLLVTVVVCGPPILMSMVVGLMISLFQAVTQIQEQTLTFVPKLIIVLGTIMVGGLWMMAQLVKFTQSLFALMPKMGAG